MTMNFTLPCILCNYFSHKVLKVDFIYLLKLTIICQVITRIYEKRDNFSFEIINFPNLRNNKTTSPAHVIIFSNSFGILSLQQLFRLLKRPHCLSRKVMKGVCQRTYNLFLKSSSEETLTLLISIQYQVHKNIVFLSLFFGNLNCLYVILFVFVKIFACFNSI